MRVIQFLIYFISIFILLTRRKATEAPYIRQVITFVSEVAKILPSGFIFWFVNFTKDMSKI